MDRIAFIIQDTFIYWSSIILVFAALTAAFAFLAIYLGKGGSGIGSALAIPMALALSLVLSRLVHWYCRSDAYESFTAAMTNYSKGGFAMAGIFAGCILTAVILRFTGAVKNLPQMLDAMALAGAAGIPVGRMSFLFNGSDRGALLESIKTLPLAYPVTNPVSGLVEYRLATFMLQAIVTAGIFVGLMIFYLLPRRKKLRDGDTCMLFLAFYGTAQIVFDSTRYDSLYLRSNGFVSAVQILGLALLLFTVVIFSIRLVQARGWNYGFLGFWIGMLALLGGAGYMEYYVQRHGDEALFAYTVMSICLILVLVLLVVIRQLGKRKRRRRGLAKTTRKASKGTA
jgi:prolipoprotein diacylglyceryltransferase